MNEDVLQAECFKWVWNNYPKYRRTFFRVKNEGKKDIRTAMKDRAMGNVPGIPDIVFMEPRMGVELKVHGGRQSKAQKEVQNSWYDNGIDYFILWSMEEFKELIISKMGDPNGNN